MISRSAFTQLHYSAALLAGTVAGLGLVFLAPPALALAGSWPGAAAWGLMSAVSVPVLRFYRRSPLLAPLAPLPAAFYIGATLHSAWSYWSGTGVRWKGRACARPDN